MDFLPASDGRISAQLRAHLDYLSTDFIPANPTVPHGFARRHATTRSGVIGPRSGIPDSPPHEERPSWHSQRAANPPCPPPLPATLDDDEQPAYLPLSRTTDRVLRMLLEGDLSRIRAESVAEALGISCTTLRRRLRGDHTNYQFLLDRARQYRCEARLKERWLPGKCLADELGYLEVNSFYRAFRRWTGVSYSEYRQRFH